MVMSPVKRLIFAVLLLLAVTAVGTAGFVIIENLSIADAVYMTLATISTLGMKAHALPDFSLTGQIWIVVLIVIGVGSAMIALSMVVSLVVEGQVRSILGRRKVSIKIAGLSNHIIVCGYGLMGQSVCDHLKKQNVAIVVIDHDDHKTALAEQHDLLYILGDASDEATLRSAGIERAKGLISVADSDAANVFITLVARDLNEKLLIVTRAEKYENESRLLRAGADKAICPQVIGANRLANTMTRPGVVEFIEFAAQGIELEAEQYHIEPQNKLVGKTLAEANLPKTTGLLVIAVKRDNGETFFNPSADTTLEANDQIVITGQVGSLAKLAAIYQ